MKSLKKEADGRETSSVAWFYRTLRNAVIDHYRRTGARNRALESFARELEDAVEPPPELHDEICGCVSRLASTLKPEYADAIRRIHGEGGIYSANGVIAVEATAPSSVNRTVTFSSVGFITSMFVRTSGVLATWSTAADRAASAASKAGTNWPQVPGRLASPARCTCAS